MKKLVNSLAFPIQFPINKCSDVKVVSSTGLEYIIFENLASDKLLLYSHGNGETLDNIVTLLKELSDELCMSVFAYEYPNEATAEKLNNTAVNALNFVETLGFKSENLILCGRSLGSAPTMHLATILENMGQSADCVVLVSPLSSLKSAVKHMRGLYCFGGILSMCVTEEFPNDKRIEKTNHPLLLIHGKDDELLPPSMSQELFARYGGQRELSKLVVLDEIDHNNILKYVASEIQVFRKNLKE
jgi:predicted alpha/beta hydrolase family esterase